VKEQNKHRLALIDARFGARSRGGAPDEREAFERAFGRARDAVIVPVMEDVAEELRALGHDPRVTLDDVEHEGDRPRPAVALRLGLRGRGEQDNYVAFGVVTKFGRVEVLAWLVRRPPPFDLLRYAHPDELAADHVEQLLVDAIEQLFSTR